MGDKPIGSGQYGKVYAGSLRKEGTSDEFIKVAVKTTRGNTTIFAKNMFDQYFRSVDQFVHST